MIVRRCWVYGYNIYILYIYIYIIYIYIINIYIEFDGLISQLISGREGPSKHGSCGWGTSER